MTTRKNEDTAGQGPVAMVWAPWIQQRREPTDSEKRRADGMLAFGARAEFERDYDEKGNVKRETLLCKAHTYYAGGDAKKAHEHAGKPIVIQPEHQVQAARAGWVPAALAGR